MVNIGIPKNYTASPSDLHGASLTSRSINHEAITDLDSSNAFEGTSAFDGVTIADKFRPREAAGSLVRPVSKRLARMLRADRLESCSFRSLEGHA